MENIFLLTIDTLSKYRAWIFTPAAVIVLYLVGCEVRKAFAGILEEMR